MTRTLAEHEQSLASLKRANRIRVAKAAFKSELKSRPRVESLGEIADRIELWDDIILSFRIRDITRSVKGYGPKTSLKIARYVGCSQDDRVGTLVDEQLLRLVAILRNPRLIMPHGRGSK